MEGKTQNQISGIIAIMIVVIVIVITVDFFHRLAA
jgi:hypothetical protein